MADNASFIDYYDLLGVATNAEPVTIRQAFLLLAKEHHPDVGGSTEQMQQFSNAYRTLMSEKSRKAYDMMHDFHVGNRQARYRDYGAAEGAAIDDLADDEIDDFLDTIFAEYHNQPKPKVTLLARLRQFF